MPIAARSGASINQRLEDYWSGLRLQQIAIPAINLVRTPEALDAPNSLTLPGSKNLYLRLTNPGKDRSYIKVAHRNMGYVTQVIDEHPLLAFGADDTAKFRDWSINR